jgi:BASS family bile acid:Na+ symporter
VRLFPVWALIASGIAVAAPAPWIAMQPAITWLLGIVMLGMGATLTLDDFRRIARRPLTIGIGAALQFGLMPALAWLIGNTLGLPLELTVGLVLVGAAPGGTASNVICYLARGDVALSISLTFVSTLLSVVATPGLTWLYVGASVPVPAMSMLWSIARVILLPVALGVALRRVLGERIERMETALPLISMLAILWIIAIVVGLNADQIGRLGPIVVLAVASHNLLGLAGGYGMARLLRCDEATARTLSIEVGMQNSGLGVALATQYFSSAAALPGAVFSIWHNLSGSVLATWWSRAQR